jgi:CheY-like chemotaxis protein
VSNSAGGRWIYSIGAVARMLDLSVATIRNWEERYAVVVPGRSAGGQRLYSRDQVEQLRYVASQIAQGLSAADAHRLLGERDSPGTLPEEDRLDRRTRPLVLIAERDPVAAELTQAVLEGEGYELEPVYAASVAEALWVQRRPPLAIVELMISGGQGAELCRRLKKHATGAVLATSPLEARDDALAAGADTFLRKPVDPVELVSAVRDLLAAGDA